MAAKRREKVQREKTAKEEKEISTEEKKIADNIRNLLEEKSLSQMAFCKMLGWDPSAREENHGVITPSKLSKMLTYEQKISLRQLIAIADKLYVSPAELMGEAGSRKPMNGGYQLSETLCGIHDHWKELDEAEVWFAEFQAALQRALDIRLDDRFMFKLFHSFDVSEPSEATGIIESKYLCPCGIVTDCGSERFGSDMLSVGIWFDADYHGFNIAIVYTHFTISGRGRKTYVNVDQREMEQMVRFIREDLDLGDDLKISGKESGRMPLLGNVKSGLFEAVEMGALKYDHYDIEHMPENAVLLKKLADYYELYRKIKNSIKQKMSAFRLTYFIVRSEKGLKREYELFMGKEEKVEDQTIRKQSISSALEREGYQCECDPAHTSFEARDGVPYMLTRYLVPIDKHEDQKKALQKEANVCVLCPVCEAKLRKGKDTEREEMLIRLYTRHKEALRKADAEISLAQILKDYEVS